MAASGAAVRSLPARRPAAALRALVRGRLVPILAATVLLLVVLSAVLAPLLAQYDPLDLDPISRLLPPDGDHWFGTDGLGRDVFARTLYGGRVSLTVGLGVALLGVVFGLLIGTVAGFNRMADALIMRVMDGMMAIPGILLAAALVSITRPGVGVVIVAIAVPEVPRVVRLVRAMVLSVREQPYIEAALLSGTGLPRILMRHVLPNILTPIIVQATFSFGVAILIESYLSLLGAGVPPEIPSWGNIITNAADAVRSSLWPVFFPGLFVGLTVLSTNVLGDSLRDYLDPRFVSRARAAEAGR